MNAQQEEWIEAIYEAERKGDLTSCQAEACVNEIIKGSEK